MIKWLAQRWKGLVRLQSRSPLALALTAGMGAIAAWALPTSWFLPVFLFAIAVTVILGALAAASAKEKQPPPTAVKFISFFLIGTSRPTAEVPADGASWPFQLVASFALGMGLGIVILAHA